MTVYFRCFYSIEKNGLIFLGNSPLAQRKLLLKQRVVRSTCKEPTVDPCLSSWNPSSPSPYILESSQMVKRRPDVFMKNEEVQRRQSGCPFCSSYFQPSKKWTDDLVVVEFKEEFKPCVLRIGRIYSIPECLIQEQTDQYWRHGK